MFGHQEDQAMPPADDQPPADNSTPPAEPITPPLTESNQAPANDSVNSLFSAATAPTQTGPTDVFSPAGGYPKAPTLKVQPGGATEPPEPPQPYTDPTLSQTEDLVTIKKHALEELMPLIDKLDQTPEDRFKTLLMIIQASDNQSLIEAAYQAAHNISDEQVKAQALLDVVNEINYFTHPPEKSE